MRTWPKLEWLIASNLTLNKSKTEFILIGSRQRLQTFSTPPSLFIDNAPIHQVVSTKCLGVYVDEILSWNVHIGFYVRSSLTTASLSGGGCPGCPGASTFGTASP